MKQAFTVLIVSTSTLVHRINNLVLLLASDGRRVSVLLTVAKRQQHAASLHALVSHNFGSLLLALVRTLNMETLKHT